MLNQTYLSNIPNVKKANPGAELINVTRSAGSVLAPSWDTLNLYKAKKITWDGYIERFLREMDNPVSRAEMMRIGNLAKTKDVYILCFERKGNCHRFLLVDMINEMMRGPIDVPCQQQACLICTGCGAPSSSGAIRGRGHEQRVL